MQCNQCGNTLLSGAQFCTNCGASTAQNFNTPSQTTQNQVQYQQPTYQDPNREPLSVGSYLLMFIVMSIPLVNFIMLFVWAFGNTNINRKNFAKASLIIMAIGIVLSIIFAGSMAALMMNIMESEQLFY